MNEILTSNGRGQVEELQLGDIFLRFLMDGPNSNTSLTIFEMTVQPQGRMPLPHYHLAFDEALYGLSGKLRTMLEGKKLDIRPGESRFVPRGAVHAFENPFEEPAKVLVVITPGVFGMQYFREVAALLAAGGPPDPKALGAVMLRHGLVPVVNA